MKTRIFAIGLVVGFIAGGFAIVGNDALAKTQKKNQWQYQCFASDDVAEVTSQSNTLGESGWELATAAGAKGNTTLWCFKRPLWKIVTKTK